MYVVTKINLVNLFFQFLRLVLLKKFQYYVSDRSYYATFFNKGKLVILTRYLSFFLCMQFPNILCGSTALTRQPLIIIIIIVLYEV